MTEFEQGYGRPRGFAEGVEEMATIPDALPYQVKPYGHGFEVQGPGPDGTTIQVAQIKRHPNATEEETRSRAQQVAVALNQARTQGDRSLDGWRRRAKDQWHNEGVIEIDPDARVSLGVVPLGAYVEAWVWVGVEMDDDS